MRQTSGMRSGSGPEPEGRKAARHLLPQEALTWSKRRRRARRSRPTGCRFKLYINGTFAGEGVPRNAPASWRALSRSMWPTCSVEGENMHRRGSAAVLNPSISSRWVPPLFSAGAGCGWRKRGCNGCKLEDLGLSGVGCGGGNFSKLRLHRGLPILPRSGRLEGSRGSTRVDGPTLR